MRFYRLVRLPDQARAFDGEGARLYPGRWNPPGVPVVYASQSLALATLEVLVHLDFRHAPPSHHGFVVDVPDALIERLDEAKLPQHWREHRHRSETQAIGGEWAASLRTPALLVPSVLVPDEKNLVLNPRHPDFAKLTIGGPMIDTVGVFKVTPKPSPASLFRGLDNRRFAPPALLPRWPGSSTTTPSRR